MKRITLNEIDDIYLCKYVPSGWAIYDSKNSLSQTQIYMH